ncbi:hypothetical protein ARHIZOSPH14_13890 [Agromyces rhizosphaerae]|uniref:SEFIR domain-containing protein n=1 Tax=Agromyces rhizosphaerae TaxID=88374 RepID=A0A9W6CVB3_9MICO|nr:toll/interleukin-1 receptor domain-containing protein [Agromyces rhizosphaerae]GLI27147.1 hypothetical protein ARHIZOSPH14_13890 [Agromyces rhizosphaerae]
MQEAQRSIRIFISYVREPRVSEYVFNLSEYFRENGLDCRIDQYVAHPPNGWRRWCNEELAEADFVLALCTAEYAKRSSSEGTGGSWEWAIIANEVADRLNSQTRIIPVIQTTDDSQYIPIEVRQYQHYVLNDQNSFKQLYRRLTDQPAVVRGPVKEIVEMPPEPPSTEELWPDLSESTGNPRQLRAADPVGPRPTHVSNPIDLSAIMLGHWAVDVQTAGGLSSGEFWIHRSWSGESMFQLAVKFPLAQAEGHWEVRPGHHLVMEGMIQTTMPVPQVAPYSFYNIFDTVSEDELRGVTGLGEFVIWRRIAH